VAYGMRSREGRGIFLWSSSSITPEGAGKMHFISAAALRRQSLIRDLSSHVMTRRGIPRLRPFPSPALRCASERLNFRGAERARWRPFFPPLPSIPPFLPARYTKSHSATRAVMQITPNRRERNVCNCRHVEVIGGDVTGTASKIAWSAAQT
jgi:hypothetical protein